MATIDSLLISLNLDEERFRKGIQNAKQETAQFQKKLDDLTKSGEKTAQGLEDAFSKSAQKIAKTTNKLKDNIDSVRYDAGNSLITSAYMFAGRGRKTNPYSKAGVQKDVRRMNDKFSWGNIKDLLDEFKGGGRKYFEENAKRIAEARGVTSEFNKQSKILKGQFAIYNAINEKAVKRRELLKEISKDEKALRNIEKATPNYANRKDYQQLAKKTEANRRRAEELSAFVVNARNGEEYKGAESVLKNLKSTFFGTTKNISEDKISELANTQALMNALNIKNTQERVKLQKQIERGLEKEQGQQRNLLRVEEKRLRNLEKTENQYQRRRYYLEQETRHSLSDLMLYGGGAFLGDRVIRGSFDSVAKLQKLESQVDTWNLNKEDRYQFDLIADRILKSSPLMTRAEATDATLAGMTSMGHFDPEVLKMVLPEAVKYAQGSKLLGYTEDTIANVIKNYFGVVEARQQTLDPTAMLKTFKTLWQVENVTGGKVTVKDFETILRNLGPGAPLMSDEGLLNLVAFAEQIKVAGHGGGGGAGAGISTVGNLIKMLQLTASGKPTSISAKKMMSELFNINKDGSHSSLMDTEIGSNATQGGITFVQAMSNMKNIAQQTMEILGGADKSIAKAGFADKQGMWEDPVRVMGAMRGAFLRGTYLDKNGKWDEKKARLFYRPDQIDTKNKQLVNVNTLDEQKAISSLIAQMGFQHRTTTAMATFMNPFFLKRSAYTIESAKKQMNPMEWLETQYKKGNWNIASQEFEASMTRLGESLKPLVADFADLTRTISKFITSIAEFNESHPFLTSLNGLLALAVSLTPALGMVGIAFERLNRIAENKKALKALEIQRNQEVQSQINALSAPYPNAPLSPQEIQKRQVQAIALQNQYVGANAGGNKQLPVVFKQVDSFCTKVNGKFLNLYSSISGIVSRIGGLFLRMIPIVGTALIGFDLASIVASWFADIEITVDGQTKRIGDIIDQRLEELENKWRAHRIFFEEEEKIIQTIEKQHRTVDNSQDVKDLITDLTGQQYTDQLQKDILAGKVHSSLVEDEQIQTVGLGEKTVAEIISNLQAEKLLPNDFSLSDPLKVQENLKTLVNALIELEKVGKSLTKEIADKAGKSSVADLKQGSDGKVAFVHAKENEEGEKLEKLFSFYREKNLQASANLLQGKIKSTYFNLPGDTREVEYDNLLNYREMVVKSEAKTDADKKKKKEELVKVDEAIVEATKEEVDAFNALVVAVKDNKKALYAFADLLNDLAEKQLVKQGQTSLMADKIGTNNLVYNLIQEGYQKKDLSFSGEIGALTYANNKHLVTDKNGKKAYKESPNTQLPTDNKNGGTPPSYYVPQNVKFVNALQAQYDESKANIVSLLAGRGKKGMEYAKAFVLQKLLSGGLSLSNKNPHESPYLKNKSKGLVAENVDWNAKDKVTGKTLTQLAEMKYSAEQAKLAENAVSKFAQFSAKAEQDFLESADLIASGGVEKLPNAITSLNREVAKVLSQLDKDSPAYQEILKTAHEAQVNTALSEVAKSTSSRLINIKELEAEGRAYNLSSTDASRERFLSEQRQRQENHEHLIRTLEGLKSNSTDEQLKLIQKQILQAKEGFIKESEELDKKWLRDNETAGASLVRQWTDLSKQLDTLQTEMMTGFIDMTEQMLDGNLDSWRDYAYNLLKLIRRQILQATFSPLLSVMTGLMNKGIASFIGDDKEANRQDAGIQQAGQTAYGMLGNGFYQWIFGKYLRGKNPYENGKNNPADKSIVDENGIETNYTGSIDDGTSSLQVTASPEQTQESWWNSFTTTFSEGFGSLWDSTKQVFSWMGDGISSLADGFMSLCGQPIEWLKNAFTSCANVIVEFMTSLATSNSAKAISGVITSVFGAVAGGVAGGGNGGEFGLSGDGYDYSQMGNRNFFAEVGKNQFHFSANANGGIVTSRGEIDLRKYARGGIARTPQLALFGEGSMPEAYVPLPDGRSIPVSFRNNGAVGETVGGNQISIVINVSNTNSGSSETSSADATEASKDASDMLKLGNRIKAIVRQEIITQSRPGGLLAQA